MPKKGYINTMTLESHTVAEQLPFVKAFVGIVAASSYNGSVKIGTSKIRTKGSSEKNDSHVFVERIFEVDLLFEGVSRNFESNFNDLTTVAEKFFEYLEANVGVISLLMAQEAVIKTNTCTHGGIKVSVELNWGEEIDN